jgi:hypothetical protein
MTTINTARGGIPVFLAGRALQSLRDSGYDLPAALGEVIDNSLEANANHIAIQMDEGTDEQGKHRVHRISFVDDGAGMSEDVLHHYPQIGYSSRYMRTDTIGKFGVGAKLAALNYGMRLDVWSRTKATDPWRHVFFDLGMALKAEEDNLPIEIAEPDDTSVPDELRYLLPENAGTLVVWSEVDRLEHGRRAKDFDTLRLDVEKELSRIFRVFINNGIEISVNGRRLLAHDPLMLMHDTWAEEVLTEYYTKGDGKTSIYKPDPLDFTAEELMRDEITVAGHKAWITVTLYPQAILRGRYMGGDNLAKKLRVDDNKGAISFMRMDREISYTNVPRIFPKAVDDPHRFIGIEVSFSPALDDYFGVRNVKRGAEPHDELKDKIKAKLAIAIPEAQKRIDEYWGKASRKSKEHVGEHGTIAEAAAEANKTMPKGRVVEDDADPEQALADLVTDVLGDAPKEDKEAYVEKVKDLPFIIESVDFPGKQFIDIQHVGGKVIIRINTRHRFYREAWQPLKEIAESTPGARYERDVVRTAQRTIETLTLLLIAYGKAESMHPTPHDQYSDLRDSWGMFLDSLMTKVKDVL